MAERTLLRLAGGLLVGGLLLTLLASHEHPAGDDDNYPVIFAKYAKSNDWVAVHLVQFAGVLLLLGGLLVLYRVLQVRGEVPVLAVSAALPVVLLAWWGLYNSPKPASGFTTSAPNPGCDFFAAPTGSDSNAGTSPTSAFRTVSKLDSVLGPDKMGCLESGDYGGSSTLFLLNTGGSAGHPATITADTGATPVVHGGVRIYAANLTLSYIHWDGTYSEFSGRAGCSTNVAQPLDIEASNVVFTHNDVSYANTPPAERPDGIGVAWNSTVSGVVITYNKIHDWGSCDQADHGIYYDHANNGIIANNWIWNGPCSYGHSGGDYTKGCGGGIQLYTDPNNTQVYNNVIDGAGVGCYCDGSNNNLYHNIFSNLIGIYYQSGGFQPGYVTTGGGAAFHNNLWWNAPAGCSCDASNLNADPQYVDAANHNYAVTSSSPAASWGLWAGF